MPITQFDSLPDSSRVWVYGASAELGAPAAETLLKHVDRYLETWAAHGAPLVSGRHWSENRFLTIAVDQEREGASGCSIDGLFRTLKGLEPEVGAQLVTSGVIYFRDDDGKVQAVTRDEFTEIGAEGRIDGDTEVFDTSVITLGEWRGRFSSRAADSWHGSLMHFRAGHSVPVSGDAPA
ncbi:MAG: hypothetical protein ABIR58_07505 [Gemmatimonadaceae bacterium]